MDQSILSIRTILGPHHRFFYAQSSNYQGKRHELVTHLRAVAELAAQFAGGFQAGEAAHFLGLWHDLGKFHPKFQRYLIDSEANPTGRGHGPNHKLAGATLALYQFGLNNA